MALDTVQEYVTDARVLLQDTVAPYRYPDAAFLSGLNVAVFEARRKRPDMFLALDFSVPSYAVVDSTTVFVEEMYRPAFLYYVCGYVLQIDEEETEDRRAALFMANYNLMLGG